MPLRRTLPFVLAVAAIVMPGSARAQQSLVGRWSADQRCAPQAPQIVFRSGSWEMWERGQRIFSGGVRYQHEGNQTAVQVQSIGRDPPPQPGAPELGDVATFRREGNRLFGVAVTRNGERRAALPGAPPFYLCRS